MQNPPGMASGGFFFGRGSVEAQQIAQEGFGRIFL
jgi:hypothetical protein